MERLTGGASLPFRPLTAYWYPFPTDLSLNLKLVILNSYINLELSLVNWLTRIIFIIHSSPAYKDAYFHIQDKYKIWIRFTPSHVEMSNLIG